MPTAKKKVTKKVAAASLGTVTVSVPMTTIKEVEAFPFQTSAHCGEALPGVLMLQENGSVKLGYVRRYGRSRADNLASAATKVRPFLTSAQRKSLIKYLQSHDTK